MPLTNRFALFVVDVFIGLLLSSLILYLAYGFVPLVVKCDKCTIDNLPKLGPKPISIYLLSSVLYWTAIDYISAIKKVRDTRIIYINTRQEISLYHLLLRSTLKCFAISLWPFVVMYTFLTYDEKVIYDQILDIKRIQVQN